MGIRIALDIETTGLDPERDSIIEIGAVKFKGDEVLETWTSLVNPRRRIPLKVRQLTGISQDQLDKAPPLHSIINSLARFVRNYPVVGHSIQLDLEFLNRGGLPLLNNPTIDTFELASILLPHAARYSLGKLAEDLGIEFPLRHRALEDALATKEIFLALLDQAKKLPLFVIQEINRLASRSDWPLRGVFREVERELSHRAFSGSIGQRLMTKAGGEGFFFAFEETAPPLRPSPVRKELDVERLAAMLEEGGLFAERFPGYEYRPQQVEMLKAIAEAMNEREHLLVEAGTGVGKCLTADAMIILKGGERVPIGELIERGIPDKPILCLDKRGRLCYQRIKAIHDNGIREVWRLRTKLGREITATSNHLFLTFSGWVELKEISIGDRIATVRRLPPGEDDVKEYEAFVIGAMLGDGGCIYSDIYWDKVVAIEPMGEAQTFDITMEGEPNFIANDIVVHNSIAYLLPAIHFSVQNGERVVISTNTINLQDQLFKKDIPDIKKILPFDFKASLLKGRTNYICLRRLEAFRHSPNFSSEEMNLLAKILVWLPSTMTGDQAELFIPSAKEGSIWRRVSSDAEACLAERCSFRRKGKCFFYRARRGAESAHLIIVNHALLLADVAVENRVLPDYNYLIVDEAHHLEEACTKQLSFAVDQGGVIGLLSELSQSLGGKRRAGFLADVMGHLRSALPDNIAQKMERFFDDLHEEVDSCERSLYEFFNALTLFLEKEEGMEFDIKTLMYSRKVRLTPALRTQPSWAPVEMAWDNLSSHFLAICNGLERLYVELSGLEDYEIQEDFLQELIGYINRVGDLREQMEAIVVKPKPSGIYWAEISAKGGRVSLHAAPLHVGNLIERHIFSPKECVILTSATLQTEGNFDYIRERLWAWDVMEKAVGSPFDYKSSTLLYIPNDIPEPYQPYYQKTVERAIVELCRATGGRTLVLFTSHSQLRATSGAISRPLAEEEIVVYSQGEGISRNQLLERFRSTPRAVLLGTRSFWEGIDVVGPALSCIVIARLPFSVPTDPIFAARSETFEDPFLQYAIPEAILRFRQGFGRLIRSKTDRGVVVVLDKRIITKPYGRAFLNSIPPCTVKIGTLEMLPQETIRWIEGHL